MLLEGFDPQWIDDTFRVGAIAREVESHFERLLARRQLQIRVWDADQPLEEGGGAAASSVRVCTPVDYAALCPGASVSKEVELGGGQVAVCNLCVLPASRVKAGAAAEEGVAQRDGSQGGGGAAGIAAASSLACLSASGGAAPARFFVSGRRISTCGSTPSFARLSSNRWTGNPAPLLLNRLGSYLRVHA